MYRAFRIAIVFLTCFLLISCNSKSNKALEGNIDVDAEIYIVPVGDIDEKYLQALVPKLEKRFTTKVYLALDQRLPNPDYAYDFESKQYVAIYILTEIMKVDLPKEAKILGVTNVDLSSPESGRLFIFGQAHYSSNGRAALISSLRMDPNSYVGGKPNDELLIRRMTIEAIHELGHVFGLRNCADPKCVMFLPRDLKELDNKTDNFCPACQASYHNLMKEKKKTSPKTNQ